MYALRRHVRGHSVRCLVLFHEVDDFGSEFMEDILVVSYVHVAHGVMGEPHGVANIILKLE